MAIALSHEDLESEEILEVIADYEEQFQLPTTDVLSYGCQKLVQALSNNFPQLNQKITQASLAKIPESVVSLT